jgi:hypothetical protein
LGPNPGDFLSYTLGGEARSEDERAKADIETLRLNCPPLVRSRAAIMDEVRSTLGKGPASVSILQDLLGKHPLGHGGKSREYTAVVQYFLHRWLEKPKQAKESNTRRAKA